MTSSELHVAIRNTYPAPNFTYLQEVRDATGFDGIRSADALAIGMYRSCGRLIHGFELKVSRSDWLRELKDPSKAESIMRYCHRWSLIVPDASMVHDGELPPTWGLGVPFQSRANALPKIKWIVKPPELAPEPFSMVFLSALIYASQKAITDSHKPTLAAQYEEGRKRGEESVKSRVKDVLQLQTVVDAFEAASGVHIGKYTTTDNATRTGLRFKEWLQCKSDVETYRTRLQQLREQAERVLAGITSSLMPLENI